jgi:hypothetical protein
MCWKLEQWNPIASLFQEETISTSQLKCPILKLKTLISVWPAALCQPERNEWVEVSLYKPLFSYLPHKVQFLEFHENLGRKTCPVMYEGYVCSYIQNIL